MVTRLVILIWCCVFAVGCSSVPAGTSSRFIIEVGGYDAAFNQTRQELTSLGFILDRVDARAGVLTTKPLSSGGLATPWDRQQTSLNSEIADLAHKQKRVVRVTFVPESAVDRLPSDKAGSQIAGTQAVRSTIDVSQDERLVGVVVVTIERLYRPYWRPSTVSVSSSSHTRDPSLGSRGMYRSFSVVTQRDHALEEKLASRVRRGLLTENE
ncbi:MAG: hypothetical protein COB69_00575 [Phycisphaera sp.]|nr:MAG: hypothetical protein COB69_00575 [Phycisphaera sp.]